MFKVIEMLKEKYGIHCVILYGSRTTDSYFPESDYDILSIRESGERVREVFRFDNKIIDLIVDTDELIKSPENYTYLWSHEVLLDENGFGAMLLDTHRDYLNQAAFKLPSNRVIQRKKQLHDELKYVKRGGDLGHYRRHDLLAKILPLYFNLVGEWYLGDKHALNWLMINKPDLFNTFAKALRPEATVEAIESLVEKVCNETND